MTTPPHDDGGPAFPALGDEFMQTGSGEHHPKSHYGMQGEPGMSLRDWFAGQALTGLLAESLPNQEPFNPTTHAQSLANGCYMVADAMLEARKRG